MCQPHRSLSPCLPGLRRILLCGLPLLARVGCADLRSAAPMAAPMVVRGAAPDSKVTPTLPSFGPPKVDRLPPTTETRRPSFGPPQEEMLPPAKQLGAAKPV